MIVIFDDKHKSDLQFLTTLQPNIIAEFCKISLEFLRKGANKKLFTGAAQKLGVDANTVQRVVEGISHLFGEASRYMLSDVDFDASLALLAFPESINTMLKELYLAHQKEIRTIQYQLYPHLEHFVNLDWRLDIQLGSRTLRGPVVDPVFILKLDTANEAEPHTHYLQADAPSLRHITSELETALNEVRSSDARRVFRNVK